MANTIRHKRSSTTGATPAAGSLVTGELAVNTADGKLFTKKDNGTVVEIGGGGGGTPAGSTGQVQFNNAGAFGADNALTFNSTTNVLTVGDTTNNVTINPTDATVNGYSVLSSRDPLMVASDSQSIHIGPFSSTATRLNLTGNSFGAYVYQLGDFKGSLFIGRSSSDFTAAAALSLNAPTLTLGTTATSVTIGSTTAGSEVDVGNAQLNGTLKDTAGSVGTSGQVLTSTGTGVAWAAASGGGGGTKTYAVFTPLNGVPPSSAYPTISTTANFIIVYDFDAATDETVYFIGIMPEAASLGSGLKIRLHWFSSTTTTGTCRWGVQLERQNTSTASSSFDTAATAGTTVNASLGVPVVTEITITAIDGIVAGDPFRLAVYRDADGTSGTDDMTGDARLISVEVRSAT